jgi:hypothetical protein
MKTIAIFALSLFATVGCSTLTRQKDARHAGRADGETRGVVPVHAERARALASGPAVIKHLETDGEGVVTLYLTDDPGIGDGRCPTPAAEDAAPVAVLGQPSRITDVAVPAGKRICAAVKGARPVRVAWHARAVEDELRGSFDLALAH